MVEKKVLPNLRVSELLKEFKRSRSTRAFVIKKENSRERDNIIGLVSLYDVLLSLYNPYDFSAFL